MKQLILAIVILAFLLTSALSQQCDGCMVIDCQPSISTSSGWGFTPTSAANDAIANARAGCYAHNQSAGVATVSQQQYWGVYFTAHASVECNCN